eukprot:366021-Chlamydomonas_euryale.AAC.7
MTKQVPSSDLKPCNAQHCALSTPPFNKYPRRNPQPMHGSRACPCRHMSWQRSVEKGMRSFQDLINIPRLMHPDIYDSGEKQATDMYKFHGKVMDPYYKKNPLASWNLFANNNEGWDELERRSRYFHNRYVADAEASAA